MIVLRDATPDDAAGLARMHVDAWRAAYAAIFPQEVLAQLSVPKRQAAFAHQLAAEQSAQAPEWTIAAAAGAEIVGFASGGPSRDDDAATAGELYALYVAPAQWDRGVGSQLMAETVRRLHGGQFADALVWVLEDNERGRRFYERRGWTPDGARRPIAMLGGAARSVEVRYRRALLREPGR